jgi:hypothetical protein
MKIVKCAKCGVFGCASLMIKVEGEGKEKYYCKLCDKLKKDATKRIF